MKTVLLINFSITLGKASKVYEHYIKNNSSESLFDIEQFQVSNIDSKNYRNIFVYLYKLLNRHKINNIYVLKDLKSIPKFLPTDKFSLIALDRHDNFENYNINNNIEDYKLITLPDVCQEIKSRNDVINIESLNDLYFDELPTPDVVILCFNMDLVPPRDRIFFDLLIDIISVVLNRKLDFDDTTDYHIY